MQINSWLSDRFEEIEKSAAEGFACGDILNTPATLDMVSNSELRNYV